MRRQIYPTGSNTYHESHHWKAYERITNVTMQLTCGCDEPACNASCDLFTNPVTTKHLMYHTC